MPVTTKSQKLAAIESVEVETVNESSALTKLKDTRKYLNSVLFDMNVPINLLLTAVVAKKHCVFIGLPGTAKSYLCRLFSDCIVDSKTFEVQLDESMPKTQVFGSTVKGLLTKSEEEHDITGSLADSHFAVVHEIFKANSVLLNSLLSITEDDRIFYNNKQAIRTPLWSLFASSNELPEPNDSDGDFESPLLDRLFIRVEVVDTEGENCFKLAKSGTAAKAQRRPELTMADIEQAHREAAAVTIEDDILSLLTYDFSRNRNSLREKMQDEGLRISPRRQLQLWGADGVSLLKAHAYLNGRDTVTQEDFAILTHCLCRTFDDKKAIYKIVRTLKNPEDLLADQILDKLADMNSDLMAPIANVALADLSFGDKGRFAESVPSYQRKLLGMISELESLTRDKKGNHRPKVRNAIVECKQAYNKIGSIMNSLFPQTIELDEKY